MPITNYKTLLKEWVAKPLIGALIITLFIGIWSFFSGGTPLKLINAVVKSDIAELKEKDIQSLRLCIEESKKSFKLEIDENENELNQIKNNDLIKLKIEILELKSHINSTISSKNNDLVTVLKIELAPLREKLNSIEFAQRRKIINEENELVNKKIDELSNLLKDKGEK
jgi:hypothetical protein